MINAETGAETRERPPKRPRDNDDAICVGAIVDAESQVWGAGFVRRVGAAARYRGRVVARGYGDIFPVGCPSPGTGERIWRVLYDDDGEEYDTPERFLYVAPTSGLKTLKAATDATADALVEVKREKEALEDRLLCTICMEADAPRAVVFGPCDHFLACASCAAKVAACPNCRATITTRTTIANSS